MSKDENRKEDSQGGRAFRLFGFLNEGEPQEGAEESSERQGNESRVQRLRRVLRQTLWLSQRQRDE